MIIYQLLCKRWKRENGGLHKGKEDGAFKLTVGKKNSII